MRNTEEVYWTTSLPRDHEALKELDAYSQEWGGLSRAEATRRLLIEWMRLRRGQPISAWISQTSQQEEPVSLESVQREKETRNKVAIINQVAKAASRVLDD